MKKITILLLIIAISFLSFSSKSSASNLLNYGVPYETYTLSADGRRIPTQTAYIPVGLIGRDLGLSNASDLFFVDDLFYIADTGNKRILVIDVSGNLVQSYTSNEFIEPTGIFVKDNFLYVADKLQKTVFQIDLITQEIVLRITKPTSPIYGQKNDFVPIKVAVDSSDSIYIIGEGSTSGVIQVNYAGEFVGYLGINTVPLSLRRILYNFFVKDTDLASNRPASPTNIALGSKGSILTTNANVRETFKRLNITGVNTLAGTTSYPDVELADIWMNSENYIYMISRNGEVFEYDSNGNLLFYFNTRDFANKQTLGLTSAPRGIVTDSIGNLYVLDSGSNNFISVYQRTVFVDLVHEAVTLFNDGRYVESKGLWEEILRQNSSFALAHSALGYALAKEGNYDEALIEFFDAKDYKGYSDTYWQIRNIAIQENLSLWIIVIISSIVFIKVSLRLFKKTHAFVTYTQYKKRIMDHKLAQEVTYSINVIKRPQDMFFGIKRMNEASYLSGLIIWVLFLVVYLVNMYGTGFLFRDASLNNVMIELVLIAGIFMLYVVVNYLVSTLNDGEGRFKDVFIASSYILVPFIIFTLPMTVLSHFLTYNEGFIFSFYHQIVLVWTVILIVISIQGVHNYTMWETIKNIIVIIFGMFILILLGLLIYAFLGQMIEFITSLIREVIYRV
jgi:tetratricopeptide (TPR) repeat protein